MDVERQPQTPSREVLFEKLKALSSAQQSEVMDFIDFLATTHSVQSPLEQHVREAGTADADLEAVRKQLSTIDGRMSDTVRDLRDKRG